MRLLAIGGSDAGISAGPRAQEHDPAAEMTLLVAVATAIDVSNHTVTAQTHHGTTVTFE
jgi:hypothetical protein